VGVLVLALALPLALFWQSWAGANPSHIHYKATEHTYQPKVCGFSQATGSWTHCQAGTSTYTTTHYVNLAPWATPGAVGIALLGVALALGTAARQRRAALQ
jgi:hypothetical protein